MKWRNLSMLEDARPLWIDHRHYARLLSVAAEVRGRTTALAFIDHAAKEVCFGYLKDNDPTVAWAEPIFVHGSPNRFDFSSPRTIDAICSIIQLGKVSPNLKAAWTAQWARLRDWKSRDEREKFLEDARVEAASVIDYRIREVRGVRKVMASAS